MKRATPHVMSSALASAHNASLLQLEPPPRKRAGEPHISDRVSTLSTSAASRLASARSVSLRPSLCLGFDAILGFNHSHMTDCFPLLRDGRIS
jgi:hypothetical protein